MSAAPSAGPPTAVPTEQTAPAAAADSLALAAASPSATGSKAGQQAVHGPAPANTTASAPPPPATNREGTTPTVAGQDGAQLASDEQRAIDAAANKPSDGKVDPSKLPPVTTNTVKPHETQTQYVKSSLDGYAVEAVPAIDVKALEAFFSGIGAVQQQRPEMTVEMGRPTIRMGGKFSLSEAAATGDSQTGETTGKKEYENQVALVTSQLTANNEVLNNHEATHLYDIAMMKFVDDGSATTGHAGSRLSDAGMADRLRRYLEPGSKCTPRSAMQPMVMTIMGWIIHVVAVTHSQGWKEQTKKTFTEWVDAETDFALYGYASDGIVSGMTTRVATMLNDQAKGKTDYHIITGADGSLAMHTNVSSTTLSHSATPGHETGAREGKYALAVPTMSGSMADGVVAAAVAMTKGGPRFAGAHGHGYMMATASECNVSYLRYTNAELAVNIATQAFGLEELYMLLGALVSNRLLDASMEVQMMMANLSSVLTPSPQSHHDHGGSHTVDCARIAHPYCEPVMLHVNGNDVNCGKEYVDEGQMEIYGLECVRFFIEGALLNNVGFAMGEISLAQKAPLAFHENDMHTFQSDKVYLMKCVASTKREDGVTNAQVCSRLRDAGGAPMLRYTTSAVGASNVPFQKEGEPWPLCIGDAPGGVHYIRSGGESLDDLSLPAFQMEGDVASAYAAIEPGTVRTLLVSTGTAMPGQHTGHVIDCEVKANIDWLDSDSVATNNAERHALVALTRWALGYDVSSQHGTLPSKHDIQRILARICANTSEAVHARELLGMTWAGDDPEQAPVDCGLTLGDMRLALIGSASPEEEALYVAQVTDDAQQQADLLEDLHTCSETTGAELRSRLEPNHGCKVSTAVLCENGISSDLAYAMIGVARWLGLQFEAVSQTDGEVLDNSVIPCQAIGFGWWSSSTTAMLAMLAQVSLSNQNSVLMAKTERRDISADNDATPAVAKLSFLSRILSQWDAIAPLTDSIGWSAALGNTIIGQGAVPAQCRLWTITDAVAIGAVQGPTAEAETLASVIRKYTDDDNKLKVKPEYHKATPINARVIGRPKRNQNRLANRRKQATWEKAGSTQPMTGPTSAMRAPILTQYTDVSSPSSANIRTKLSEAGAIFSLVNKLHSAANEGKEEAAASTTTATATGDTDQDGEEAAGALAGE